MEIQPVHRKIKGNSFSLRGFTVHEFDRNGFGHVSATYLDGGWELSGNNLNNALKSLVVRLISSDRIKLNSVTKHISVVSDLDNNQGLSFYMSVEDSGLVKEDA